MTCFSQQTCENAEQPLGGVVLLPIAIEAFSNSYRGDSDLIVVLHSSQLKWEQFVFVIVPEMPTWYLRTSSCSFKTCISCLESPKPSSRGLLLWASSCCLASGLLEGGVKQDAGSYPEAWLCDRPAAPVGLLLLLHGGGL